MGLGTGVSVNGGRIPANDGRGPVASAFAFGLRRDRTAVPGELASV